MHCNVSLLVEQSDTNRSETAILQTILYRSNSIMVLFLSCHISSEHKEARNPHANAITVSKFRLSYSLSTILFRPLEFAAFDPKTMRNR